MTCSLGDRTWPATLRIPCIAGSACALAFLCSASQGVGRPSKVEVFRDQVERIPNEEPSLPGVEILSRLRGFGVELCWPRRVNQKGSAENLVGWVKGSFFKVRRFHDLEDLQRQLIAWLEEVNLRRPSRATTEILCRRSEKRRRALLESSSPRVIRAGR